MHIILKYIQVLLASKHHGKTMVTKEAMMTIWDFQHEIRNFVTKFASLKYLAGMCFTSKQQSALSSIVFMLPLTYHTAFTTTITCFYTAESDNVWGK
jgi:hypothetical protein